jgi:hypothetical protein
MVKKASCHKNECGVQVQFHALTTMKLHRDGQLDTCHSTPPAKQPPKYPLDRTFYHLVLKNFTYSNTVSLTAAGFNAR